MRTFNFSGKSPILMQGLAVVIASASMILAAGCGAHATSSRTVVTGNKAASGVIHGQVHGGRQPIVGATVTIWEAGNTGYGSSSTYSDPNTGNPIPVASTTTDPSGNFNFGQNAPYTCPSDPTLTGLLYITAQGGTTTDDANSAPNTSANLIAWLGPCATVIATNPYVVINEVSTVSAIFALQQFFNGSTESIGTSSTNLTGLINAGSTINNLVNTATGQVYSSQTVCGNGTGSNGSLGTSACVVITPDAAKINTIANILAYCINDTTPSFLQCQALSSAVSGGLSTGFDTLQIAYFMAAAPTDPTSPVDPTPNISTVYGFASSSGPFQTPIPLSSAPNDWTIGVTYGSEYKYTGSSPNSYILANPVALAIDGSGDVWIANLSTGTGGSLTELSPTGTPMLSVLNGKVVSPVGIVIDPSNNVFVSNWGSTGSSPTLLHTVNEYISTGPTAGTVNTFTTGNGPGQMVSDPSGNIFIVETSATVNSIVGGAALAEIPAGSANGATATSIGALTAGRYSGIVMDQYYNIWVGGGENSANVTPYVYSNSGTPTWTLGTPATTSCTSRSYGAAIDSTGNIWLPNENSWTVCEVNSSSTGVVSGPTTYDSGGGLAIPYFIAVDGAGNLWVSNNTTSPVSSESVSEFSNSGTAFSPSTGFQHTFNQPYMIAVDASGNVWVANFSSKGTAATYGIITEIVGAAAPTVTPIVAGLPFTPCTTTCTMNTTP